MRDEGSVAHPRGKADNTMVMLSPGIWHPDNARAHLRPHETLVTCSVISSPGQVTAATLRRVTSVTHHVRNFETEPLHPKPRHLHYCGEAPCRESPQVSAQFRMFWWELRGRDLYFSDSGPEFVSAGGSKWGSVRLRVRAKKHDSERKRVLERDVSSIPWCEVYLDSKTLSGNWRGDS